MARKTNGEGKKSRPKDSDELFWLETYFIVFPSTRRPTLSQVEHALAAADSRLHLENLAADDDGLFQSLLVESPEDHAAVEVSYETGEAVVEQNLEWAKQLQTEVSAKQFQQLIAGDARLDVAHFERVQRGSLKPPSSPDNPPAKRRTGNGDEDIEFGGDDDEFDADSAMDIFDPTCLLTVVETLSQLTHGLAFDPAAGEVL